MTTTPATPESAPRAVVGPLIKQWYDHLHEGRLMGYKCSDCGHVEFPPVPMCNECGSTAMDWFQMSGDAELYSFAYTLMGVPPYMDDPMMIGYFKLAEGPEIGSWLLDVDDSRKAQMDLLKQLPVHCKAEITVLDDRVSWPVFRIAE